MNLLNGRKVDKSPTSFVIPPRSNPIRGEREALKNLPFFWGGGDPISIIFAGFLEYSEINKHFKHLWKRGKVRTFYTFL